MRIRQQSAKAMRERNHFDSYEWGYSQQNMYWRNMSVYYLRSCGRNVKEKSLLYSAAKAGNIELLVVVIHSHPELIWQPDYQNWTIFHVAVLYREEKVFSLIHQIGGMAGQPLRKQKTGQMLITMMYSLNHNNSCFKRLDGGREDYVAIISQGIWSSTSNAKRDIVVHGEKLPKSKFSNRKHILEKLASSLHKVRNNDGRTPRELFIEEHKLLLKEGKRWMKDTVNSCMIVATLITMMLDVRMDKNIIMETIELNNTTASDMTKTVNPFSFSNIGIPLSLLLPPGTGSQQQTPSWQSKLQQSYKNSQRLSSTFSLLL
ncbi:hypothetical protein H5410_041130, partial [Solanum commersonii]